MDRLRIKALKDAVLDGDISDLAPEFMNALAELEMTSGYVGEGAHGDGDDAVRQIAGQLAVYYNSLTDKGVPEMVAATLAVRYQEFMFGMITESGKKESQ